MKRSLIGFLFMGVTLAAIGAMASAGDSKDEAIRKDRKQIEGTWRITALEIDGNKSSDEDVRKLTVVNGADGTWSVRSEDKEVLKGTSTIDPTKKPKTIDLTPTEGDDQGKQFLGIYELGEDTRKLCLGPNGLERPTDFTSTVGSQRILVIFQREKVK